MKVLIFGGTTEGRLLAGELLERGFEVTVSVATPLGAEELEGLPGLRVLVGRRDREEMAEVLGAFDRCVDATHPYAVEASGNIRSACEQAGVPLCRLLRRESRGRGSSGRTAAARRRTFWPGRRGTSS